MKISGVNIYKKLAVSVLLALGVAAASAQTIPNRYIVTMKSQLCNGAMPLNLAEAITVQPAKKTRMQAMQAMDSVPAPVDCQTMADQLVGGLGGVIHHHYANVFRGYAATLSPEAAAIIRSHPYTEKMGQDTVSKLHPSGIQKLPGDPASKQLMQIASTPAVEVGTYRFPASGKDVRTYVIDSGIKPHIDYRGRLLDAVGLDLVQDGFGTRDCFPHGTNVAGIIAGKRVGMAKDADLVSIRVFGCAGPNGELPTSPLSRLIAAVEFVVKQPQRPAVINMSLGASDPSGFLLDAVKIAIDRGFTVVASAGNESAAVNGNRFPQPNNGIVIVGALGFGNQKASFSNFGQDVIYAPGSDVSTTVRDQLTPLDFAGENKDFHNGNEGTSFAAPFVTGIAAMLLEKFPNATPAQIKQMIEEASLQNVVTGIPLVVPVKPLGDAVNTNNLWNKSFAVKTITGRSTTSGWADLYWRPFAKVELKITDVDTSNWLGNIEVKGAFTNGWETSCIIRGLLPMETMSCEMSGPAIKKWSSKTAFFEVTSVNGKKVTYDRNQNLVTKININY